MSPAQEILLYFFEALSISSPSNLITSALDETKLPVDLVNEILCLKTGRPRA